MLVARLAGADPIELVGELEHPPGGLVGERLHDVLLVREVEVEGAVAGARALCDVVDAGGRVPAVGERGAGGVEEPLARPRSLGTDDPAVLLGGAHGPAVLRVRLRHSG